MIAQSSHEGSQKTFAILHSHENERFPRSKYFSLHDSQFPHGVLISHLVLKPLKAQAAII